MNKSLKALARPILPKDERREGWSHIRKTLCAKLKSLGFSVGKRTSRNIFSLPGPPCIPNPKDASILGRNTENSPSFWLKK